MGIQKIDITTITGIIRTWGIITKITIVTEEITRIGITKDPAQALEGITDLITIAAATTKNLTKKTKKGMEAAVTGNQPQVPVPVTIKITNTKSRKNLRKPNKNWQKSKLK